MNIETIERARKCISRFVAEFDAEHYNKEEEPSWVKEGRLLTEELKMKRVLIITKKFQRRTKPRLLQMCC